MLMVDAYQRRWLAAFGVTLAILLGVASCLTLRLPSFREPAFDFYSMKPGEIFNVHGMTRRQSGSVKLGFAESHSPPEIGVYGNHIIDSFGADAFDRPYDGEFFFNYYYANLSLPEIQAYLDHIEQRHSLPKKLILIQITPPNADNGRFIINWGDELPPDVLLGDLKFERLSDLLRQPNLAWRVFENWLHEVLNYNTLILSAIQGSSYSDRIVGGTACQSPPPRWFQHLPHAFKSLFAAYAGHDFYCWQTTWWGAYRRDGSAYYDVENRETPLKNEDPLSASDRGLRPGDEYEIARQMHAIDAVGRRQNTKVAFFIPPVFESDRHDSVVNQIFDRALALVPDMTIVDNRNMHDDPSLFRSSLHPSSKYFHLLVEQMRRQGIID
jgi:hypothetical protein